MKCISCEKPAKYCMRGLEKNAYCEHCAKGYFKMIDYLDKM